MYKETACFGIIAAGGLGSRFGGSVPKQFAKLSGKPVLAWAADIFEQNAHIDAAVMVINASCLTEWRDVAQKYRLNKFVTVPGGADRQSSVYAGLRRVLELAGDAAESLVVVHDGARPLASQQILDDTLEAAYIHGGAVAAVPVKETIKETIVEPNGVFALHTPDRANLYAVQTPQAFRLGILLGAHIAASSEAYVSYDDASLVERTGNVVRLVDGSYSNIKITDSLDIILANTIIKGVLDDGQIL